jgi:hypothetical protein
LATLDNLAQHKADSEFLVNALANDASAMEKADLFYFSMTQILVKQKSFTIHGVAGQNVDLVVCFVT